MKADILISWLKKKKASDVALSFVFGALALLAGLFVLLLTFWFTYAIVYFIGDGVSALWKLSFNKSLQVTHTIRLVCSGAFIVLLFIQHFKTNPWHWGEYPVRDDYSPIAGRALGMVALVAYPGASANMIADILLSGPRLVTGSWNLATKAIRLRQVDEAGCAELLAFLYSRGTAVPYSELKSAGWEAWFPQLRCIDGVVFLEKGLSLSSELRSELATLNTGKVYGPETIHS